MTRLVAYAVKAAREAKERTSWTDPDEEFEEALTGSIEAMLSRSTSQPFLDDLQQFVAGVAGAGRWNALARTLLHLTAPGTPDVYQGDELWHHALVDPDNRRPVDFEKRTALLDEVERDFGGDEDTRRRFLASLMASPADGRIKLHVTMRALHARRERPRAAKRLLPIARVRRPRRVESRGIRPFGRPLPRRGRVPRLIARKVLYDRHTPIDPQLWYETRLRLPSGWPIRWTCALSGNTIEAADGGWLACDALFARLPVSLVLGET